MIGLSKEISNYLLGLLGEKKKKELTKALAHGKTIVVSGNHVTGKTTLTSVLNTLGYSVTESENVHELELTKPLVDQVRNLDIALLNSTEIYPKLCWIPISDRLPEKGKHDWVLVKTDLFGGSGIPHVAELRNGVWHCDCCNGPMEEILNVKVVAWFDMQTILEETTNAKN